MNIRVESPVVVLNALAALPLSDAPEAKPSNDNRKLKSDWMTPAEALQMIRRLKGKMRRENAHTQTLFNSPARRRVWDEVIACEECLLWQYFRN